MKIFHFAHNRQPMTSRIYDHCNQIQLLVIFLRNRCPKLVNLGHFRSISKNGRILKIFRPISLQNPTQGIFCMMKKIVSPLLLPLRTIFSFKNAQFKCNSKNGRILVVLGHKHQHIILRRCSNNILILTLAAPSSDHNFYSSAMCYKSQKNARCCTTPKMNLGRLKDSFSKSRKDVLIM